ncbi:MAG: DUF1232 domain-containing protein [Erysipelotrichaceae bacterium]|nr:DUF1232 domain-containing protein [Erysipelotrichaceae bacterium]
MKQKVNISETKAAQALKKGFGKAKAILEDDAKMEGFLKKLERKLKKIPMVGGKLSKVPVLASMVRAYALKQYKDVPVGTIIAIISALVFVISAADLIPDYIPFIGYIDDAAIMAACWKLVSSDVEDYEQWRKNNQEETVKEIA